MNIGLNQTVMSSERCITKLTCSRRRYPVIRLTISDYRMPPIYGAPLFEPVLAFSNSLTVSHALSLNSFFSQRLTLLVERTSSSRALPSTTTSLLTSVSCLVRTLYSGLALLRRLYGQIVLRALLQIRPHRVRLQTRQLYTSNSVSILKQYYTDVLYNQFYAINGHRIK